MHKIRYRNLAVEDNELKQELLAAVDRVLTHGMLILGQEVVEFEKSMAEICQRKFCIGVGSGTDALYLTLRGMGIGEGDEVITTPLTWVATTNAIVLTGATPVFADINEDLNIDTDKIVSLITPKTKAILPVNIAGQMCDMGVIESIARQHDLLVLEDASQSFGSACCERPSGSFGDASCFSINPMKNLPAYGEAGAVLTDDEELAKKVEMLRYAGTKDKMNCVYPSINGRIDTMQAAMMLISLKYFPEKRAYLRKLAAVYTERLQSIVGCPQEVPGKLHSYYSYTIKTPERDKMMAYLADNGIETKVNHALLMPYHDAYKGKFMPEIPCAERIVSTVFSLPCHDKMSIADVEYVCEKIKEFVKQ